MEPEYLEVNLNSNKVMTSILDATKKYLNKLDIPAKKKGGLNEITDLRALTAKMLNKDIKVIYGITKGWSKAELYEIYHASEQFVNPPALWWTIYKKKKNIYGKTNKKEIRRMGEDRRNENSQVGQKTLF